MSTRVLILGIGGQDGSYLARHLLTKGYEVHGLYRRTSLDALLRINDIIDRLHLHRGDLADGMSVDRIIRDVKPDYIYNEADQDHVATSRDTPSVSIDITAGSVQRLLETVLRLRNSLEIRVFQPISATIFGQGSYPQTEDTPLRPDSPYACAKANALHLCQYYRRLGVKVTCGIMYNHESPTRGPDYLLQRIIRQATEIKTQLASRPIRLANAKMLVDIGWAPEFMKIAVALTERMLSAGYGDEFLIGTGHAHTIRELVEEALAQLGISDPGKFIIEYMDIAYRNEPILIADTTKLMATIGIVPTISGGALIRRIINKETS